MRLRGALIIMAMVLSVFGVRLFQLQGLDPKAYAARAAADGLVKVTLPAARGDIVDRNGAPLAVSVAGKMIVADPQQTAPDAAAIARILADKLGLDYFDVLSELQTTDTRFRYIARRVPSTKATNVVQEIAAAGYKGIDTRDDPLRDYPAEDVASNLVGFIGNFYKDGVLQPAAGLERVFNNELSGVDGHDTYELGSSGARIPLGENTEVKPKNGQQLKLTIDRDAQWMAQRLLRKTVHDTHAQSATAIAMDTQTGELLVAADYPSYNANETSKISKADLIAKATGYVYEPGSVEKVLTSSALINENLVTPETRIKVPSQLPVLDRVIHDYFVHPMLHLTLAGVIAKSSNIGTVLASRTITHEKLGHYLRLFGLGQKSNLGLSGESGGLLPDPSTWSSLSQATISFGQGLAVNAVQMAAAVNTIANKGEYISPSLIEGNATTASGQVVGTDVAKRHQVITPQTASKVAQMMEMVTTEGAGTAPGAGIPGYRVAGKTGTAQQVGKKCGCYDGSLAVSFAGFAPADNPRFTVYVVVQKPGGGASGGGTAGPVFRELLNYLLQKYAVPPTGTKPAALPVEW